LACLIFIKKSIISNQDKHKEKNFGATMDRTLRLIKLRYLQTFREADVDITPEQWVIIDTLFKNNGISQTELANGSFKNAPTVSRIIDLLCKKGWTERQRFENDRRRYKIFLTPAGLAIYNKLLPKVIKLRKLGWQNLSEQDYQNYVRIMNQIFENFGME